MSHTILVAHDYSEQADAALAWAADFAKRTNGSLRVVHVVPLVMDVASPLLTAVPFPLEQDIAEARRALRERAERNGISAVVDVLVAVDAGAAIVEHARAVHATILALGTHGRGGLKRMILGSVAEYVVRHAHCPVLTTRLPREERPRTDGTSPDPGHATSPASRRDH